MADQTERPNLSRRRMLQTAAVLPLAVAIPTLAVANPAQAAYRGEMSRKRVMARAWDWYNRGVTYNGGLKAYDRDGDHRYRRDCSGFVSMCLHSSCTNPDGGHSTRTLPNIARQIQWKHLAAGDLLNSYDDHCVLFDSWSIVPGELWIFELDVPGQPVRHRRRHADYYQSRGYIPRQYQHIHDS